MNQHPAGNRNFTGATLVAAILITILGAVTILSFFTVFQMPDAITEEGARIDSLWQVTLAICLVVFFMVTAGIIWAIFRYRRRGPELPEQIHGSDKLEMAWTIIPILILVGLFAGSIGLLLDLKQQPSESEADIVIEVVGHQWWWEFIYPASGIRIQAVPPNYEDLKPPALVLPVGKTVLLKVRSTDVIHSFYAPNTLYKIQAIPGNINQMHFKLRVKDTGTYHGQCYQFCGLRHSDMLWILDARSESDFQRWVSETRRAQGLTGVNEQASVGAGSDAKSE